MSNLPKSIGRYEILGAIGRGGMGSLFLALDPKLDRQIAIKVLRDDDDELRERFAREARAAARLRHNNIVTIFDVGEHEGQPFIAMEYIQGQTLAEIVRGNVPVPIARKLELIEALCDGLGFAHKSGIIHRDVKPANLMLDADGSLKILDFGIARAAEASGMTQAGMLIGTLNYMSPEQVSGQPVDLRSDLFAVGAVFYEVISYRQAFPGGLTAGILNKIMSGQPEPLASIVPDLDPQIVGIVERALEKDPAHRYQDLGAMRRDIATARLRLGTDSPTIVAPLPPVATDAQPTPTPGRRSSTDLEGLARRRAEQIRAHMSEAEEKLAAGDADGAIGLAEQVLLLDANHGAAHALIDRARVAIESRQIEDAADAAGRALARGDFEAAAADIERAAEINPQAPRVVELRRTLEDAARRADEARQKDALDRRAREVVVDAEERFRAGRRDEGVALLASFHPPHPFVAQALERLRAELARHVDSERARAEAAAREGRIASGLDAARAAVASGSFGDAVSRLRALEDSEGPTTAITSLLDDAMARHRDAERVARVGAQIDAHLADAEALLAKQSLQPALAKARAALALDVNHVASKDLVGRVEKALHDQEEARKREQAKRDADAKAQREREKASAAALKEAKRAASPAAAVAILTAALERDTSNAELRRALETRDAEAKRAAVRDQQRAFEQAARDKGIASADDDDRTVVLRPADTRVPAAAEAPETVLAKAPVPTPAPSVEAKKPPVPAPAPVASPPSAPRRSDPGPAAADRTPAPAAGGMGLKIGIGAAAALVIGAVTFFVWGGGSDEPVAPDATPAEAAQLTDAPPQSDQAAAVATPPAAAEAPPAPAATTTVAPGAAAPSGRQAAPPPSAQDRQAAAIAQIAAEAQGRLSGGNIAGALEAIEGGLNLRSGEPGLLNLAQQARREAVSRVNAARGAAVETGEASGLPAFREGDELVQQSGAQLSGNPVQSARTLLTAAARYEQAATQGRNIAITRAAEAAQRPAAQAPAPPVISAAAEEAAIRAVIDRYRDAYNGLDVDAVVRVWPTAPAADLRRAFANFSSQTVAFSGANVALGGGNATATVTAREQMTMQPRSGSAQKRQGAITFQLQKSGAGWLITSVARR